jgi:hypothetical protein
MTEADSATGSPTMKQGQRLGQIVSNIKGRLPKPIRTVAHVVVLVSGFLFLSGDRLDDVKKWLELDKCHYRDPERYSVNDRFPVRNCLPGKITLIEWRDPSPYDVTQVPSRRNRVLEVAYVTSTGLVVWEERSFIKTARAPRGEWQSNSGSAWYSVPGAEDIPAGIIPIVGASGSGMILRRLEIAVPKQCGEGNTSEAQSNQTFTILEAFVENREDSKAYSPQDPGVYLRYLRLRCGEELGYSPRNGPSFVPFGVSIEKQRRD